MSLLFHLRDRLWLVVYASMFLLLVIWQMPGTIGLRYCLLGLLLSLTFILVCLRPSEFQKSIHNWTPIILLMSLTMWIVVVIYFWGVNPEVSWSEFRGQWLSAILAAFVGLMLSRASIGSSRHASLLVTVIFWALLAQVFLNDLLGAFYWVLTGTLPFRQAPVLYLPDLIPTVFKAGEWRNIFSGAGPDKFSYVNNILAAMIASETLQRILSKRAWIVCGNATLLIGFLAVLLCSYWLQMRNGNVGLLFLLFFGVCVLLFRLVKRMSFAKLVRSALTFIVLIAALAIVMIGSDSRWQKFIQTIPVALDTETNRRWLTMDGEYPQTSAGDTVDASAYLRLSWFKEGVILTMEHPLGTGYNRLAYGAGIDEKYHMQGSYVSVHSHSGILDFTIANGVVGLMLWLSFMGSLLMASRHALRNEQIGLAFTLIFLITGFTSRSIADSSLRDHMLQQFLFLVMFFYGLIEVKDQRRQL